MGSDDLLHDPPPGGTLSGERMLAAILNSLSEAVITVDRDHRIASFNRAAERLVGIAGVEALGKDCREVLRASFGPAQHDCPMGELGEGGKPRVDVEGTLVRADGRIVPVSASWAFFTGETGEVHGFVISFRSFEEIERIAEERKSKFPFRDIVGKTPRIRRIFDLVEVVKDTDSTVLITGESGTGKGLFARAIHDLSPRREKPFVKVNAAALTETLLESELFGHVKGAFTGAVADKVGRFEAADGGTIFLDEIGEISPALQVKLLRVLQDHEFERVGSSRTQHADVRVIAATNRDLKEEMRAGRFREDLFYRLNVVPLVVPPLRDRREDIPLLVHHFAGTLSEGEGMPPRTFSEDAVERLAAFDWPGNVRELKNTVERILILSSGPRVGAADVDRLLGQRAADNASLGSLAECKTFEEFKEAAERAFLLTKLRETDWNVSETARLLDMPRSNLYKKIERYALTREHA